MTDNVLSAARVLDLVELIAGSEDGVLLREATARLNAPKSSTLMLLRTLVNRGYAYRDAVSERYRLSDAYRAGSFGWTAEPHARLIAVARPIMEEVSAELGESVTLGAYDKKGAAHLLTQVEADVEVRYTATLGRPIPLFCTAIGRVLLSREREEARPILLGDGPFPALTRHTVTDSQEILRIVARARVDGYAIVMEEFALGGTGVAAPILDAKGDAHGALNIGCVTARFEDKREQVIAVVKAGAETIAARMGLVAETRAAS
jgi:DNA-binding IclR family transcriptional regulator